jgi:hypothetical protein
MSDDLEKLKAEVLAQIKRAQDSVGGLGDLGRGIVRAADETGDVARLAEVRIRVLPPTAPGAQDYLAKEAIRWTAVERIAGDVTIAAADPLDLFTAVGSNAVAAATSSVAAYFEVVALPLPDRKAVEAAEKEFREKSDLGRLLGEIKGEMRRLRLDFERERLRTPLSFLDEAEAAIRVPVVADGVASALLTLRSAIDRAIEELIRRRPTQEEAPNRREKILSIGRHCSKPGLLAEHFESLADSDRVLYGQLSGLGKRGAISRAEVVNLFHSSAQFLRALLMAVDETRLRDP